MANGEVLARLAEQVAGAGAYDGVDMVSVRALVDEASESGAARAMARLGLSDPSAGEDVKELRELLRAWRDAKRTARSAAIGWLVRLCMALVVLGMAVKMGFAATVRG